MKARHVRPHKDRRLGPCDTQVSGMKEEAEMSAAQCRSRTVTQIDRMVTYRQKVGPSTFPVSHLEYRHSIHATTHAQ